MGLSFTISRPLLSSTVYTSTIPILARESDCCRRSPVIQQSRSFNLSRSGRTLRMVQQRSGLLFHNSGPLMSACSSTVMSGTSDSILNPKNSSSRLLSSKVSGKSNPVSRVKTGKANWFCLARCIITRPAPWKLVPMAALAPKRSHAQPSTSSVRAWSKRSSSVFASVLVSDDGSVCNSTPGFP